MIKHDYRAIFMPYCLQRLQDGRYIVLNRKYKPLGQHTPEHVEYDMHPSACKINITPTRAARISYKASPDVDVIYLYNDGCIPTSSVAHMSDYLKRLAVLAALTVTADG